MEASDKVIGSELWFSAAKPLNRLIVILTTSPLVTGVMASAIAVRMDVAIPHSAWPYGVVFVHLGR